jgi:hypothetical protein
MGSGGGLGGGGGMHARPVAAIVISGGAVRVQPIYDTTKVALAGLATAGFMTVWLVRLGLRLARPLPRIDRRAPRMPRLPRPPKR